MQNKRNKDGSYTIDGETFKKEDIHSKLGELYTEIANADNDEEFIKETPEIKKIQYEKAYEVFKQIISFAEQSEENLFYILHKQRIFNEDEYLHITEWNKSKKIKYPQAALRKKLKNYIADIPLRQSELNKLKLKEKKKTFEVKQNNLSDIKTLLSECKNLLLQNESKYSLTYKNEQMVFRVTESLLGNNKYSFYCYIISNNERQEIKKIDDIVKNLDVDDNIKLKIKLFFL